MSVQGLTVQAGSRVLWSGLDIELEAGELLAVLGPNGAGKTTFLRVLLGLTKPCAGCVRIDGSDPQRVRSQIGYVPQQRAFDPDLPLRARDLVRLGVDGHRWGIPLGRGQGGAVDAALAAVGASGYAEVPVGLLSGGEQQRLRVAQALVSQPRLVLADEPLLSLDLAYQQTVVELLDTHRKRAGTPVVFVTHDVNAVLPYVNRVLYLAGGSWAIGNVDEVMTSETLSNLYQTDVDVLRVRGRIVVAGAPDGGSHHH
ncbi:MAG: ABC transporter ATP-binding protein [Actinobacteria bacterium]|nr:ABC transporter ATP-binding protein [Actinomycetota bacterium]